MTADEFIPGTSRDKNALERFLSLFSVVHPGEGVSTVLLTLNVFLLLGAYYILKVVRQTLILTQSGAEETSYWTAGQAVLLLFVVPAYGALASRVNRVRLVSLATLFFVSHLFIFFALGNAGYQIDVAFFLWLGVFNVFVVAQFWAFANDVYTEDQGKRLFPIIAVGASSGAWVGSAVIEQVFESVGPYVAMVIGAVVLIVCLGPTLWVDRRETARGGEAQAKKAEQPLGKEGGFQLVFSNHYLLFIALLILLLNLVNTTGEFLFNSLVESTAIDRFGAGEINEAARLAFTGPYVGNFYKWVNMLGLLIQMFLVSRVFRYLGVRVALFILPCIAIGGYALLAALPLLQTVRVVKMAENSTDYSLMNTIRAALYLPTSREAKYKAKQAIDTFFVRIGDMLQAGIVFAGVTWLGFEVRNFALVNVVFCALWLVVAVAIYRKHKQISREA